MPALRVQAQTKQRGSVLEEEEDFYTAFIWELKASESYAVPSSSEPVCRFGFGAHVNPVYVH